MSNESKKASANIEKDEKLQHKKKLEQFAAAIKRMQILETSRKSTSAVSKFDPERVSVWLQNPRAHFKNLVNLSRFFYNVSPQYRQVIWYFALMPTYAYVLDPINLPKDNTEIEKFKRQYFKTAQEIEKMNLAHEMIKLSKVAYREDVFYGYVHESNDSFFIQQLDFDLCQISSIEDGVYNFAFDFSYFDRHKDSLQYYPEEFQYKYEIYKTTKEKWIEISPQNSICIKVNEELQYPLPPFNTMFESIFDLDEYKKLKKAKVKTDNFLALTQKIPMDEKNPELNKFLIDLELAMQFHNQAAHSLPDGVGLITSPMDIEAIRLERSKSEQDTIAQAQREVYTDAGVSQHIFNTDKNTSIGLGKAIINNEQIVFTLLRQIERWINRRLKYTQGAYKFHFRFLNQTVFNQQDQTNAYLKAAQSSMPVISELAASLGMTPSSLYNKAQLETEILGLQDLLRPLASSHTQSKNDAGRPRLSEDEVSDSRMVGIDNDSDEKSQGK